MHTEYEIEPESIRAIRPSRGAPGRRPRKKRAVNVDELVRRFEMGVDLWTGKQLQGADLVERLSLEEVHLIAV